MNWFKLLLIIFEGLGVISSLWGVSKGEYTKVQKPIVNAIAALLGVLIIIGILIYL